MIIRHAIVADFPSISAMKHISSHEIWEKRVKESALGKGVYLVAEETGDVVGHVYLRFSGTRNFPEVPNIQDLFIREDMRGKGIGTELIKRCEEISREKNYSVITVAVNPVLNPRAKELYERLGYTPSEYAKYLDGVYDGAEDWVVDMVKSLTS